MPQLELAHFASQIFWLVVTFSVLYFVMARQALPKVRETLHDRQNRISSDINQADDLKEAAKLAEVEYNDSLQSARQQASESIAKAREKIQQQEAESYAKLEQNFAKQAKELEQRIEFIRKDADEKLRPATYEFVKMSLSKLIDKDVTDDDIEAVVKRVQ